MPSKEATNQTKAAANWGKSTDLADRLAQQELADAGIDPDSPEGREFLFRASVFGINGVNPPLKRGSKKFQDWTRDLGGTIG